MDGIKAKLYATATALKGDNDQRFTRFGALSISAALAANDAPFASISVKDLVTVSVSADGSYDFTLPIEVLGQTTAAPSVALSGLNAQTSVQGNTVRIVGRISNLRQDTEVPVSFRTQLGNKVVNTRTTLSFARLTTENDLINVSLAALPADSLMVIQGLLKQSRIGIVAVEDLPSSDFHAFTIKRAGTDLTLTSIRAFANETAARIKTHTLPLYGQLLTVIEKDVNLDGKNDLIFYGLTTACPRVDNQRVQQDLTSAGVTSSCDHTVLTFANMDGTPLFGAHSRWEMPIGQFEGLAFIVWVVRAYFSWIKHTTFLGDVVLPYYQKRWQMPEEDNSRELLYREDLSSEMRLYYWEPYLQNTHVKIRPRVVDSVAVKRDLMRRLSVPAYESMSIERILPQSQAERASGAIRQIISVGEGFFRRFSIMRISKVGQYTVTPHNDADPFLTGNTALPIRSMDNFAFTDNSFNLALMNRSSARIKPMVEGQVLAPWTLQTTGWSNPFFEVVASFEGQDRRTLFFESRFHVYVHDQSRGITGVHKLPINRDTSFPGVSFSETLQPALVRDHGQLSPAVAINSTLIYGDRFYTMLSSPEALTRPLALSIKIPEKCVALRGQMLSKTLGLSAYTMLCQRPNGEVDLSFFPLEMP